MTRRAQSWRDGLTLVAEEISLGVTLLELAKTERKLNETAAFYSSLQHSQSACNSARHSLGELSCVLHSHREVLEKSISGLLSAISEFRDEATGRNSAVSAFSSVVTTGKDYRSRRALKTAR
jgi:hypothetical protein